MATVVFIVLMLAMAGVSDGAWCICKPDEDSADLQKTLDYACGAGADCNPIHQNGACYNPNTVADHCSYAANSYYQRNGQSQQACDFSGTAMLTQSDPSKNGCTYPATPSAAGTSGPPTSSTNSSSTPGSSSLTPGSSFTPGSSSFPTNSPSTFGLGPSGTLDPNASPSLLPNSFLLTACISVLILLRV